MRAVLLWALSAGAVLTVASCGKAVGSEGGPCTSGGGCDPGLTCASDLCVKLGEGEGEGDPGEGEGECQGDDGGAHAVDDCAGIPAAACADIDQNETETACRDAGLTLRAGLFDAAFACLAQISSAQCHDAGAINDCFGALTACANPGAETTCTQARDACVDGNDDGFPLDVCIADLTPTNLAFRTAWADCFNNSGAQPCSDVEDACYNNATNTLIENAGGNP